MLWPIISSRHVHRELFGNLVRQALDFDFARDQFVQAALQLHAFRIAHGVHRNLDANARGQIDALQVDVQQMFP